MNLRLFSPILLVAASASAFAADAPALPSIPAEPIAKKKELLFSDDFSKAALDKPWVIVVPTFSFENGTLKGTQMRYDTPEVPAVPAADGKPEVKAKPAVKGHQAVIGNDIPTKDSVIEFRFKLGGAQSVTAEYDDRKFNGSHYGHICMARIAADKITLRSPASVVLDDQAERLPDSNPSAKIRSATPVGLAVEVNVCKGVAVAVGVSIAVGVLVRVGVDVGVNIKVGVEV